jgi:hypothetical protein
MFDLIYLVIGVVVVVAAWALLRWLAPKEGEPRRIPDKWGLGTAVPMAILTLGVAGVLFIAKAFF